MATELPPKFKPPKTLAAAADRLWTVREQRYKADKEAAALKTEESFLKDFLINSLPKSNALGISGKLCRVTVKPKTTYQAKDWDKVWAYCVKNARKGGFAILQKRLSTDAVGEIFEKGGKIDGIEPFKYVDLSINKV
jgi:hypothetical protein